jgi:hypothetical protein
LPQRARNRRPSPRGRRYRHPLRFPRGVSARGPRPRRVHGRRPSPRGLPCRPQPPPRGQNRRRSPPGLQYRPPQRPTLTVSTPSSRPKSPRRGGSTGPTGTEQTRGRAARRPTRRWLLTRGLRSPTRPVPKRGNSKNMTGQGQALTRAGHHRLHHCRGCWRGCLPSKRFPSGGRGQRDKVQSPLPRYSPRDEVPLTLFLSCQTLRDVPNQSSPRGAAQPSSCHHRHAAPVPGPPQDSQPAAPSLPCHRPRPQPRS